MGVEQSLENYPLSNCRIVVVAPRNGEECLTELSKLPESAKILAIGSNVEELRMGDTFFTEANVLVNLSANAATLSKIIQEMPFLEWVHSIAAGVDHMLCPEIVDNEDIVLTNAKGVFSSSLGEYVITACSYFAKDIPRLLAQKKEKKWDQFKVRELRGCTMGIVGYGNIGAACSRLAKAYGMKVLALRRNPEQSASDRTVDEIYGNDSLDYIIQNSDYLVVCMALTPETKHFIKEVNLRKAKPGMVLINIGRGALIDEDALIEVLADGTVAGAALDVFTVEPLPESSKLWGMPNVLISPHNADILVDSKHKSVELFVENCKRFLDGDDLLCIVDKNSGY